MSIRDHYAALDIAVADLTDAQLEAIALDIRAEFGEILPKVGELREVVQRHRSKPVDAPPEYRPTITIAALLDFEAEGILPQRRKVREIRERFGVSETRYVQLLVRACDDPEAMRYAPTLVARLTRQRDNLRGKRWGRALAEADS